MASPKSVGFVIAIAMMMLTISLAWSLQGCPENERKALLSFKHGVTSPSNRLSSWEGHDCCKWHGVGCDNETGHVVKLDLHNPFPVLQNPFPVLDDAFSEDYDKQTILYEEACLTVVEVSPSLLQLKHMNYLDLSWNNFSGSRSPDFFGSFRKLRYLNLSCARFGEQIPHHLGNLSSLSSLDLNSADCNYPYQLYDTPQLTVDTFRWTSNLFSLKHLDMSGINLTHVQAHSSHITTSLPYSLSELRLSSCGPLTRPFLINIIRNMTLLRVLDFSDNDIEGIFPNIILNMTSLTSLDLSRNSFTSSGQILDELKSLENLKSLDLSFNEFSGVLPNFSYHLHNLEWLRLSRNSFHGPIPASFGTFSNMKLLDLGHNELTGSIPSSLGRLSAIESLDLRFNELTGSIPTSIGNLSNLKSLDLGYNQLTGSIPTSIGNLSNLKSLHLYSNKLSGQIPMSLGKLFNLEELSLSGNSINGVVSEVHFAKLSKLKFLDLGYNFFLSFKMTPGWAPPFQLEEISLDDCQVGPQFPDWLRTQTRLKYLIMSNSSISGSIPNWFSDISNGLGLLDLSLNNITGSIPYSLCSSKELYYLSFRKNRLSGELPRCWNNSALSVVDFSFNQITGSIPNSFCDFGLLKFLSLSHNNLSGQLPRCWSNPDLEVVDFSFNSLEKTIPSSFCELPNLNILFLSHNLFHGEISKNLKNCTKLSGLDLGENSLSGEIPSWIGDLSDLTVLRLRSNKFTGILSANLCDLEDLRILDVGENHLSGTIPYCFGNFNQMSLNHTGMSLGNFSSEDTGMTQLIKGIEREYTTVLQFLVNMYLSSNNLVGHIPEELTKLDGLISLNLSRNNFTGPVPHKIGNMVSLESLDLSLNHLTGRIPQSISSLMRLGVLDVSFNNLSGSIPTGNQLQTFNDPTRYQGNDELCGPPLPKACTSHHDVDKSHKEDDDSNKAHKEDDDSNMVLFFISSILGFVVGFWVVCGSLFLKETWRRAYFQFVDDIPEKVFRVLSVLVRLKEKLKAQLNRWI